MNTDTILKNLDALSKLAENATKGPWCDEGAVLGFIRPRESVQPVCQTWDKSETDFENADGNRQFIATARNNWDALIEVARVAVERIRSDAKTYREYEEMHRAKGDGIGLAKAFANARLAEYCENDLTTIEQLLAKEGK